MSAAAESFPKPAVEDCSSTLPPAAEKTAYFLLQPSNMMNFPLKGRFIRFPVFTIVVSTTPPAVPDDHVLRTADMVGIPSFVALNYVELNTQIKNINQCTHYFEHKALVNRSLQFWETIVSRLDKWHTNDFDK